MAKKAKSKPMKEIVRRFEPSIFEFVYFEDSILLNEPIENWPQVDYLIAFASGGYPLDKVIQYVELRKPITINDVAMQRELLDRRSVYRILQQHNISTPRHIILDESERADNVVVENDDWIEIKGIRFTKPVVEKPVNAEGFYDFTFLFRSFLFFHVYNKNISIFILFHSIPLSQTTTFTSITQ